jgi:hypothetical protein
MAVPPTKTSVPPLVTVVVLATAPEDTYIKSPPSSVIPVLVAPEDTWYVVIKTGLSRIREYAFYFMLV